mmetsp:Transcript_33328/g.103260  ORF Transcript_33328/g.103260 Transcript_33328/m.103260 type:complete len:130 (-) Transcript_33328:578-967(-)
MTRYQTFERAEPVSPATPAKLWGNGALAIAFLAGAACAMVGNSMIPGQLSAAGSDGETPQLKKIKIKSSTTPPCDQANCAQKESYWIMKGGSTVNPAGDRGCWSIHSKGQCLGSAELYGTGPPRPRGKG